MTSLTLPYAVDPEHLPAPLPTVQEIESAEEILSTTAGRKVAAVGTHFIVKYGVQVSPLEGQTMLHIAQACTVSIPRVYAIFQSPARKSPITYIVMERIHGSTLDKEWPHMNRASKQAVALQLRQIFTSLRTLPSPGGYCSVGHQGLPDGIFWTSDPASPYAGPFDTEAELNEAMVQKYAEAGISQYKVSYYARTFAEVLTGHEPTFSHADFQRKNVMIRRTETGRQEDESAGLELVIIDWEYAGWYPSYWEYARAVFACGRWEDDWSEWLDEILEPFRNEYAWTAKLLGELWS